MKDNTYLVPAFKFVLRIKNGAVDRSDAYLDFDDVDGLTFGEIYSAVHRYFPIGCSNYDDRNYYFDLLVTYVNKKEYQSYKFCHQSLNEIRDIEVSHYMEEQLKKYKDDFNYKIYLSFLSKYRYDDQYIRDNIDCKSKK